VRCMSTSTSKTKTPEFVKTTKQREAVDLLGSEARHVMLYGGSRSGKTFILIYLMVVRALRHKSRHLILRLHFNHVKTSVWHDTLPKVLDLICPDVQVVWNRSDYYIEFPNGSEIWLGGLDDKERTEKVLGTEYSTIFFNEASQLAYQSITTALSRLAEKTPLVNRAYYDCNPPHRQHWSHRVFIEKAQPKTNVPLPHPERYASMLMNPADNLDNLPVDYLDMLEGLPRRQRDRFLFGLWLDTAEGAMWKYDWIKRSLSVPDMDRIVVAIDPAVSKTETSDETGIVVAGRAGNSLYVLADLSDKFTPKGWATVAVNAFAHYHADRIIGEVNNGGDMVESTIHTVDENAPYKAVHATRGKEKRAEPIAAIYELGRGYHCGSFPELEGQMTEWVPPPPGKRDSDSPDRMDALVWAATELMGLNMEDEHLTLIYDDQREISAY